MLAVERTALYEAALSSPALVPANAPLRSFDGGHGRSFRLRVPPDEAALHDLVKQAHVLAKRAGAASYEAAMRAE